MPYIGGENNLTTSTGHLNQLTFHVPIAGAIFERYPIA
jgi:hypothetical protein